VNQNQQFVSNILANWKLVVDRANKSFDAFSDEDLQREIAPGKNRVYYLLGHLVAVHDLMFPLLRIGDRLHPELDEEFVANPDRTFPDREPSAAELRKAWTEVNTKLLTAMEELTPEQWLERHASVSEADFEKEPHRNRLSVFLSRTTHVAYHHGQIRLAK
jgi:hypothetical protein